jgi:hypothetical protein
MFYFWPWSLQDMVHMYKYLDTNSNKINSGTWPHLFCCNAVILQNIGDYADEYSKLGSKPSKWQQQTHHEAWCPNCFDFTPGMNKLQNINPSGKIRMLYQLLHNITLWLQKKVRKTMLSIHTSKVQSITIITLHQLHEPVLCSGM